MGSEIKRVKIKQIKNKEMSRTFFDKTNKNLSIKQVFKLHLVRPQTSAVRMVEYDDENYLENHELFAKWEKGKKLQKSHHKRNIANS